MDIHDKFVEFCKYCNTCQYLELAENESPCDECLGHAVNAESAKPVYYKERS